MEMSRFIITISVLLLGCNSRTTNDNAKIETAGKEVNLPSQIPNDIVKVKRPSIIYDTLVFTENMNGEMLLEKFKSSQSELKFYNKFINPKRINKLKIITEKHRKTEIKYLGKIKDLNKSNSYHVITNFQIWGIGQMLSPRGRSEVAFINQNKDKIIIYNLSMPSDLPKFIEKNILYFEFEKTKIGITISGGLPPFLCIPEIGCN